MSDRPSVLDTEVWGVDVQSGDVRGSAPTFALVRLGEDSLTRDAVSARKLRRLIHRDEPAIVAVDNVYELAPDRDALVRLLASFPPGTGLVQVTGDERPEPLSRVASRHDVPYDSSPMGEAEAAARLAAANVGHEVTAFKGTTTVTVSRGRSPGKGGSSEDRFTRRIHGSVKRRAREVTETLEAANLDFDRSVTEKYGGWSRAEFAVDAPPDEIPVSAARSGDVRVTVEADRSDGIRFEPLARRRDRVIVGVDPGTNTAVAVVDLEGTVRDVWSSRTSDANDVVEWIVDRGRPVIVAADVATMPGTVERIRRSFDAVGWTPTDDLPVDEKLHRVREVAVDNDHERDAVAAALFAYDDHEDRFDRIERKTPPTVDWEAVAAEVLSREVGVEAALAGLTEEPEPAEESTPEPAAEPSAERRRITRLETRVDRQREHIERLRSRVAERDERIEELEARVRRARSDERRSVRRERAVTRLEREKADLERTIDEREERIEELEDKVERMKALWRLDHSDFAAVEEARRDLVPVKPVEKFTVEAIEAADAAYGLAPDDVVFLRDSSGAGSAAAELLASVEPRVVLVTGGLSDAAERVLWEESVAVGPAGEVAMQEVDELAVARESDVEAVVEAWRERAAKRRRERKRALVDELIEEHRDATG